MLSLDCGTVTKSTSVHLRLDALILGRLWGGEWQRIGSFVFPVALKTGQSKYLVGTSFSLTDLSAVPGQREGLPHWEPDLLVRTVALWERDSCTLSASLNPRAVANRKHASAGIWLAGCSRFHGY